MQAHHYRIFCYSSGNQIVAACGNKGNLLSLLETHEFLSKIKEIRNKFEHKMHAVTLVAGGSGGGTLFDMTYRIAEKQIDFSAAEFIACVKEINLLFSVIQKQIDKYRRSQNPSYIHHTSLYLTLCDNDIPYYPHYCHGQIDYKVKKTKVWGC